jgi:molybdopterin/thiamine biosynthesis adenylyltransferase
MTISTVEWNTAPVDRYARHRLIEWWKQDIIHEANVLVVGAGALGNEVLKNLALLGVGRITVVDFDMVEFSNLSRTVLFRAEDVGEPKAEVAARAVQALNPATIATALVGDLEFTVGVAALRGFDLALGCLDSVSARWLLNRLCMEAGIPWINAGINPVAAEIALFVPGEAGCYGCSMTEEMWRNFRFRQSCQELLQFLPPETLPTTVPLAALAAAVQTQEAVVQLHGIRERGTLRPGQKLFISTMPYRFFTVEIPRSFECPCHGDVVPALALELNPASSTASDIFLALAGRLENVEGIEFRYELLSELVCDACSSSEWVGLPARTVQETRASCPQCLARRRVVLENFIRPLHPLAQVPLAQLGIPRGGVLTIRCGEVFQKVELITSGEEP